MYQKNSQRIEVSAFIITGIFRKNKCKIIKKIIKLNALQIHEKNMYASLRWNTAIKFQSYKPKENENELFLSI